MIILCIIGYLIIAGIFGALCAHFLDNEELGATMGLLFPLSFIIVTIILILYVPAELTLYLLDSIYVDGKFKKTLDKWFKRC